RGDHQRRRHPQQREHEPARRARCPVKSLCSAGRRPPNRRGCRAQQQHRYLRCYIEVKKKARRDRQRDQRNHQRQKQGHIGYTIPQAMPESVDAYRYVSYLRSRWLFIVTCCAVSVALALAVSLSLTTRYTATCRILIEPPAGTVAVSPIYLESLKTYEHFVASDSLFLSALKQFRLRERFPARPIES